LLILTPLTFLAGTFCSTSVLPPFWRTVTLFNPLVYLISGFRRWFAQSPALGRKVSDEFTVPLCRGHHHEVHRCGDEANWWNKIGIDPSAAARALRLRTHPVPSSVLIL
jgi:hypothetical protein